MLSEVRRAKCWELMTVIPAGGETGIRRITVQGQPKKKGSKISISKTRQ
jgi:hypothetical protein